jgi:hypothetical protein
MFPTSSSPSAHGRWQNISSPNLAGSSSNINKPRKSQLVLSAKSSSSTVNNAQSLENMVLRGEAAHLSVKGFGNSSIKASLDALNQYRQQQQLRLIEKRLSNSSCSQIDHDRSSQHSSCEHLGFESEERSSASNTSSLGSLEKLKHGANTETFTTKRVSHNYYEQPLSNH